MSMAQEVRGIDQVLVKCDRVYVIFVQYFVVQLKVASFLSVFHKNQVEMSFLPNLLSWGYNYQYLK